MRSSLTGRISEFGFRSHQYVYLEVAPYKKPMTPYKSNVEAVVKRYSKLGEIGKKDILATIPFAERRYKCHTCHTIVDEMPCPKCGEPHVAVMCPLDHCHCGHDLITAHAYCPLCGEPVCPECGTHDVVAISRVTGYLQDVSGWNSGKRQELKDRHRHEIATQGSP